MLICETYEANASDSLSSIRNEVIFKISKKHFQEENKAFKFRTKICSKNYTILEFVVCMCSYFYFYRFTIETKINIKLDLRLSINCKVNEICLNST